MEAGSPRFFCLINFDGKKKKLSDEPAYQQHLGLYWYTCCNKVNQKVLKSCWELYSLQQVVQAAVLGFRVSQTG